MINIDLGNRPQNPPPLTAAKEPNNRTSDKSHTKPAAPDTPPARSTHQAHPYKKPPQKAPWHQRRQTCRPDAWSSQKDPIGRNQKCLKWTFGKRPMESGPLYIILICRTHWMQPNRRQSPTGNTRKQSRERLKRNFEESLLKSGPSNIILVCRVHWTQSN